MARKARTYIWVNRHKVKSNEKTGKREPVLTVECRGERRYGHSVKIDGPSELVYRPDNPRSCGARVWLVTSADVEVDGVAAPGTKRRGRKDGTCGL